MSKEQWTTSVAAKWDDFPPQAIPSYSEMAFYEQHLVARKKEKRDLLVGILGSTPEFRDLCQRHDVSYRCIDFNPANFEALRAFCPHKSKERANALIVADWREMEMPERFDMILGDHVTSVIPTSDYDAMFLRLGRHLADGGAVYMKVAIREDDMRPTHEQAFSFWQSNWPHIDPFASAWREVLLADYDFEADHCHCATSTMRLRESLEKGIISEYFFLSFKRRWDIVGDEFYIRVPRKDFLLETARRHFSSVEILDTGEPWYRGKLPIVAFQK